MYKAVDFFYKNASSQIFNRLPNTLLLHSTYPVDLSLFIGASQISFRSSCDSEAVSQKFSKN